MADNYLEKKEAELREKRPVVVRKNASLETLLKRNRSYRGYDRARAVTKDDLVEMVRTVTWTASGMNAQPLRFHLVTGEDTAKVHPLVKLGAALPEEHLPHPGEEPSAYIIACSVQPENRVVDMDLGIAGQSILLKATEMGLGGIFILNFKAEALQEALSLPLKPLAVFGIGKPSTWRKGIVKTAKDAGNFVRAHAGTAQDPDDIYGDIMGVGGVIAKAEESGYMPTGVMAAVQMRAKLRGLTDTTGQPIFISSMQGRTNYMLDGMEMSFPMNGAWDPMEALMIVGDFHQMVYSIRQDVTYKILTEATIVDPASRSVIYSLAQQDMVALRAVMRLGWEIPNPVSSYRETLDDYSPFAVYLPAQ